MQPSTKNNKAPLRLFILCFLAYTIVYIGRKNLSVCLSDMIADGVLDKVLGGTVGTAFLTCYACGQLLGGVLGDRFPPKYMLTIGLAGAGCANLCMALNSTPWLFVVLWGVNGLFASLLWPTIIRCISQGIPLEGRARAGVWIASTIPVGSLLAYWISAIFLQLTSWRGVFVACGIILLCGSVVMFCGFTSLGELNKQLQTGGKNKQKAPQQPETSGKGFGALLLEIGFLFMVFGIVCNGILKDGFDFWIPTYLTESFHLEASLTSLLTGILPVVNLLGVYIAKWVDRSLMHNEMRTNTLLFFVSALLLIPVCLFTAGDITQHMAAKLVLSIAVIALVSSLMLGINSMLLTFIPMYFGSIGKAATLTGILNASSYGAAALADFLAGILSERYGWTVTLLAFMATALAGGVGCLLGMRRWKRYRENATILEPQQ